MADKKGEQKIDFNPQIWFIKSQVKTEKSSAVKYI